MLEDFSNLLKEIRETSEFILKLPEKLVDLLLKPQLHYHGQRERIKILKELVEMREIGKLLQRLYFKKGDFIAYVKSIDEIGDIKEAEEIKLCFSEIKGELDAIRQIIQECSFSNTELATEAILFIARASRAYEILLSIPDEQLVNSGHLEEIFNLITSMEQTGKEFIKRLDEERRVLDHSYG